jgi:hypothetical protein
LQRHEKIVERTYDPHPLLAGLEVEIWRTGNGSKMEERTEERTEKDWYYDVSIAVVCII